MDPEITFVEVLCSAIPLSFPSLESEEFLNVSPPMSAQKTGTPADLLEGREFNTEPMVSGELLNQSRSERIL